MDTRFVGERLYVDAAAKQKLKDAATGWEPAKPGWTAEVHSLLVPKIATPESGVRSTAYSREFGSKNNHYHGGFTVHIPEGILYFNGSSQGAVAAGKRGAGILARLVPRTLSERERGCGGAPVRGGGEGCC
ncbi:hypothetical protein [Kibdelosporangium phytohabitans]|uniref:Uncharacterized protein n=1 Tax=Kibdelosporangium phytohabitans TaxID=860235 RepID=A0A0N7F3C9_9PSEU|nr:hypothetical protein [Kibdelosporangium phytohabitans]ALG08279.1 hypothetical protein AOZ06_16410 [Kibdelosporangium phytohabitans]MBE1470698.1 hypothetical protein [Kibdelosporangium phytohabitans]